MSTNGKMWSFLRGKMTILAVNGWLLVMLKGWSSKLGKFVQKLVNARGKWWGQRGGCLREGLLYASLHKPISDIRNLFSEFMVHAILEIIMKMSILLTLLYWAKCITNKNFQKLKEFLQFSHDFGFWKFSPH